METEMKMIQVKSSMIKTIGYDSKNEILKVTFNNDKTYLYYGVPQETFDNFKGAESIGKFFHANIRNVFDSKQMTD